MAKQRWMQRFAKWHIWLGWLVGFPILMWTVTGLVMVARPIDEVRGTHLRVESEPAALPAGSPVTIPTTGADAPPIREFRTAMQRGKPVTTVTYLDGTVERFDATSGAPVAAVDALEARRIVESQIKGGDRVQSVTLYSAEEAPFDFRRPLPAWQVRLEDGTNVYVGRDTGEIEAVRTRFWRVFDFMWGLHIMDLQTREDTHHPILIIFAVLSVIGSLFGTILMFRRRKSRVKVPAAA